MYAGIIRNLALDLEALDAQHSNRSEKVDTLRSSNEIVEDDTSAKSRSNENGMEDQHSIESIVDRFEAVIKLTIDNFKIPLYEGNNHAP